ncbi:hypothetical protein F4813DRAFT_390396 [Daldinia decipiens]|uniref:uncharacterized protein n=1 Tax=Daldinia decipiens TaxID=326647 RepID=UPI0020C47BF5|nr:uncharacterized protein F4813DRAFT_390396 [Daldinia decipiens]KAI1656689.1 hypothetical protein F4813DRAFT_390396 [Daldinia decipiens]
MLKESVATFFDRYHRYPSRREGRMVTPVFDMDYTSVPRHGDEPADITISLPKSGKSWLVHRGVISDQSNFFRMALATPLLESRTDEIKLDEIDDTIMEFIIKFMYKDWSSAATAAFGLEDGAEVPPRSIAEILIAADFLDIPRLCYAAYHMMLSGMASLVMMSRTEPLYSHALYLARHPFLCAAIVLERSKTKVGMDLAEGIQKLMLKLGKARHLEQAIRAFIDTFPDDHSIIGLELQW